MARASRSPARAMANDLRSSKVLCTSTFYGMFFHCTIIKRSLNQVSKFFYKFVPNWKEKPIFWIVVTKLFLNQIIHHHVCRFNDLHYHLWHFGLSKAVQCHGTHWSHWTNLHNRAQDTVTDLSRVPRIPIMVSPQLCDLQNPQTHKKQKQDTADPITVLCTAII